MKPFRVIAVGCLFATTAFAAGPADEPLDPEKAFRLSVAVAPDATGLNLRYTILDGYYMYRNRFKVQVVTPGLLLKPPAVPPGEEKDDPYFGKTEIHRRYVDVPVPFDGAPRPGRYAVEVTAQGCADSGFCYAPFTQKVVVNVPAIQAPRDPPIRPASPAKP
jgi:thiol:disulfide interchange protein DsbD